MRVCNLLLLSIPYVLLLLGVIVIFLCHYVFQDSMLTALFCLFMFNHPILAMPCIREVYASWAHPVIASICKFHQPSSLTSKRKVMVLLDTRIPEVFIFPFFLYLSRIYPDCCFFHSSFLLKFPIVRCFLSCIGVKALRYNELYDKANCMCSVAVKRDAMMVASLAVSNRMLLLPVHISVCDGVSMLDTVLSVDYPIFEMHFEKPYNFACKNPDEALDNFRLEWEANHINSYETK